MVALLRAARRARCLLALFLAISLVPLAARSDDNRDLAGDANRERVEQWRRELNRNTPVLTAPLASGWIEPVAGEAPCFQIARIELAASGDASDRFQWLLRDLGRFNNACLGVRSIEALRANLAARLIARGFVTSTVEVPEQNLGRGTLTLALRLGLVDAVVVERGSHTSARQPSHTAVPLRAGSVLNLRQIEQALENLARLPSQASQFRIEPSDTPDSSRIVISPAGGPRWRATLGLESAESSAYGPLQANAGLTLDAPFNLSDQVSVLASLGTRQDGPDRPRQSSVLVNYSVPLGNHLLSANVSHSAHQRVIQGGVGRFSETGSETQAQARWQWTAWRNQSARLSLWTGISAHRARTFLADTELLLRRRRSTSLDLGAALWQRHACGEISTESEASHTVRLARDTTFQDAQPGLPQSWRAQVQWACRIGGDTLGGDSISGAPVSGSGAWDLQGRLTVQAVRHPAGSTDLATIGSRWTVRGHDASRSLSGQGAAVFRQELLAPPMKLDAVGGLRAFVGIDYGHIDQPLGGEKSRRELAGLALGMRWQWAGSTGELVAARPIRRHDDGTGYVVYGSLTFNFLGERP